MLIILCLLSFQHLEFFFAFLQGRGTFRSIVDRFNRCLFFLKRNIIFGSLSCNDILDICYLCHNWLSLLENLLDFPRFWKETGIMISEVKDRIVSYKRCLSIIWIILELTPTGRITSKISIIIPISRFCIKHGNNIVDTGRNSLR